MTPSLSSVYDTLVAHAATEHLADVVAPVRSAFQRRVGPYAPTDAWYEERAAALWDRVLTDRAVLARMRELRPPSFGRDHLAALDGLVHAQRGLFEVHAQHELVDLVCVVTGAAFRLAPSDDAGRALTLGGSRDEGVSPGVIDARVLPMPEGVCILPAVLAHPAEATEPIHAVIARAIERALPIDDLLDGLLSMRHRYSALSRMKVKQIYRAEGLG